MHYPPHHAHRPCVTACACNLSSPQGTTCHKYRLRGRFGVQVAADQGGHGPPKNQLEECLVGILRDGVLDRPGVTRKLHPLTQPRARMVSKRLQRLNIRITTVILFQGRGCFASKTLKP